VVATAGHVDHGKSALVRALTGMEPDRYAEEQRRGMTIDLGFVWTTLGGTSRRPRPGPGSSSGTEVSVVDAEPVEVAFVDVPGHERFVPTMLAGVGAVPAVLFVVAADEGWMPQSSEHLDVLEALGVRHAVVAVTRSDLADPTRAVRAVRRRLVGTELGDCGVVPVSVVTGVGLGELRAELMTMLAALPTPDLGADVRLWVDRSFTVAGAGTVVTGTLPQGTLKVGDELELHAPGDVRTVVVRGLQSLGRSVTAVGAVARVAVNLRGVRHDEVRRGDALVAVGTATRTDIVDVRVRRLRRTRESAGEALPAQGMVHLGSVQLPSHLRPFDASTARVRLSHPVPLRLGDRLVLRDPGRHLVVASATVLDPNPPALLRRGDARRRAELLAAVPDEPAVQEVLDRRGVVLGASLRALGFAEADVLGATALRRGDWLVNDAHAARLRARLVKLVADRRQQQPLDPGLALERARQLLDLTDVRLVLALVDLTDMAPDGAPGEPGTVANTELTVVDGRLWLGSDHGDALPPGVASAVDAVREELLERPFAAPDVARLAELALDRQALAAAVRHRLLARVGSVYLLPGWEQRAVDALRQLEQPFSVSDARRALGTTRRVAVPVLEALDAARITLRMPDDRRELRQPSSRS
jgi:selenocysteine-specific elongation factor